MVWFFKAAERLFGRALTVTASAALLLATAVPALAHAILVESTPALNGTITGPDVSVDLRFNSRIDQKRSLLLLRKADGTSDRLDLATDAPVDRLRAKASLQPGNYTLRWQVLATDGHITRGDVPFAVNAPGAAAPAP